MPQMVRQPTVPYFENILAIQGVLKVTTHILIKMRNRGSVIGTCNLIKIRIYLGRILFFSKLKTFFFGLKRFILF